MNKLTKTALGVIALLIIALIAFNAVFTIEYYAADSVKFQNLDNVRMSARYRESSNGKGVLIVTDLSHDKSEYSSLIYELSRLGYGVYIFDLPSQGNSGGTVPYYSNTLNYFAEQFYCAIVAYSQLADMPVSDIYVVGYGTGARAALQTAALGYIEPAGMALIGCDINLTDKIEYNILNYSDDTELAWVKQIKKEAFTFPIALIYSSLDRKSKYKDNEALSELIFADTAQTRAEQNVRLIEAGMLPHFLLTSSGVVANEAAAFIAENDGTEYTAQPLLSLRTPAMALAFFLFACALMITGIYMYKKYGAPKNQNAGMPKRFYTIKLLMWLPALLLIVIMALALYSLPIPFPYSDIIPFLTVAAYGIAMLFMYKFTTFGENMGKRFFTKDTYNNVAGGLRVMLILVLFIAVCSLSGMRSVFSFRSNWLWILLYTAMLWPIFFIDEKERKLTVRTTRENLTVRSINYAGLAIAFLVQLILGMYNSAFITLIEAAGLLFIYSAEKILFALRSPTKLNAFIKAFVFQLLIFAQSPIFNGK